MKIVKITGIGTKSEFYYTPESPETTACLTFMINNNPIRLQDKEAQLGYELIKKETKMLVRGEEKLETNLLTEEVFPYIEGHYVSELNEVF
jgi:hypothetical protein